MPSQTGSRPAPSTGQVGSDGSAAGPHAAAPAAPASAVQWSAAAGPPLPPLSPIAEGDEERLLGRLNRHGAPPFRSLQHNGGFLTPPLSRQVSGDAAAGESRSTSPGMGQMPITTNRALGTYITEVRGPRFGRERLDANNLGARRGCCDSAGVGCPRSLQRQWHGQPDEGGGCPLGLSSGPACARRALGACVTPAAFGPHACEADARPHGCIWLTRTVGRGPAAVHCTLHTLGMFARQTQTAGAPIRPCPCCSPPPPWRFCGSTLRSSWCCRSKQRQRAAAAAGAAAMPAPQASLRCYLSRWSWGPLRPTGSAAHRPLWTQRWQQPRWRRRAAAAATAPRPCISQTRSRPAQTCAPSARSKRTAWRRPRHRPPRKSALRLSRWRARKALTAPGCAGV